MQPHYNHSDIFTKAPAPKMCHICLPFCKTWYPSLWSVPSLSLTLVRPLTIPHFGPSVVRPLLCPCRARGVGGGAGQGTSGAATLRSTASMTGASRRSFASQHTSVLICLVSYMWVLCDIVWLSFGVIASGPTRGLEDSHLLHVWS